MKAGIVTVPGPSFDAHAERGRTKIRSGLPRTDGVLREAGERLPQLLAP